MYFKYYQTGSANYTQDVHISVISCQFFEGRWKLSNMTGIFCQHHLVHFLGEPQFISNEGNSSVINTDVRQQWKHPDRQRESTYSHKRQKSGDQAGRQAGSVSDWGKEAGISTGRAGMGEAGWVRRVELSLI